MEHTSHNPGQAAGLKFEGRPVEVARTDDYDALADLFLGDEPAQVRSSKTTTTDKSDSRSALETSPRALSS